MDTHPFSISPNPANLYVTPGIAATMHKVRFVIENRQGLTCIMGDVGMGIRNDGVLPRDLRSRGGVAVDASR